ncbi:MAG: YkgJ family cysteine cluster protein [Betaproteobacteria bacterium]
MLRQLLLDIDSRVESIRENRPDWLCGKGCDGCCRHLAAVPQLTAAEWALLREGMTALPVERQEEIARKVSALSVRQSAPVICPILDNTTGACPVYAQRPVACRTYGFYVQRDKGLYCHEIEARVDAGSLAEVVWGNHDAVDCRLAGLGASRSLSEWFVQWERESASPLS